MMPIAPLMIEHRLIERMIDVMKEQLVLIEKEKKVDREFIETAVDFIRTYADRCHHGKEEDILFRDLGGKKLTDEHKRTMEELVEDKHFFIPYMEYFSEAEKEAMLKEEWEFDKSLIHEKYRNIVIAAEKTLTAKKLLKGSGPDFKPHLYFRFASKICRTFWMVSASKEDLSPR